MATLIMRAQLAHASCHLIFPVSARNVCKHAISGAQIGLRTAARSGLGWRGVHTFRPRLGIIHWNGVSSSQNSGSTPGSLRRHGLRVGGIRIRAAAADVSSIEGSSQDKLQGDDNSADLESAALEALGVSDFASLGVDPVLVENLKLRGFSTPTYVQAASFPAIRGGYNVALQSHTGSGKTLAYMLPLLSTAIDLDRKDESMLQPLRMLVVVPSRELAMQIVRQTQDLVGRERRSIVQQAIGGANTSRQVDSIRRNKPLLVVGTPGRVAELSRLGVLKTHQTGILVLDEVDDLLKDSKMADMTRIAEQCGKRVEGGRQTVIVSATLTDAVLQQTEFVCPSPQRLLVTRAGEVALGEQARRGDVASMKDIDLPDNIQHVYVMVDRRKRVDTLRRAIHALDAQQALIFMNFNRRLEDTAGKLSARSMQVESLHGGLDKQERQSVMQAFHSGQTRAMVVSDIAARGLDFPDCDAVFNLELPTDAPTYAHRAGRTGRFGRPGLVVTLVEASEAFVIQKMEKQMNIEIPEAVVKNGQLRIVGEESSSTLDASVSIPDGIETRTDNSSDESLDQSLPQATTATKASSNDSINKLDFTLSSVNNDDGSVTFTF